MVMRSSVVGAPIPAGLQAFEIAGGGTCYTDGTNVLHRHRRFDRRDWQAGTRRRSRSGRTGRWTLDAPALTRVVTYALAAALRRRRLFELHSGALVHPESGRGLLIIGPSGSGKSTLTVHLAAAGWSFLTDDVLLLSQESDRVKAWPLRRCFAITSDTFAASRFLQDTPSLDYTEAPGRGQETVSFRTAVFTANSRTPAFPERCSSPTLSGGSRSRVSRLSPADTMARLIRMSPVVLLRPIDGGGTSGGPVRSGEAVRRPIRCSPGRTFSIRRRRRS